MSYESPLSKKKQAVVQEDSKSSQSKYQPESEKKLSCPNIDVSYNNRW